MDNVVACTRIKAVVFCAMQVADQAGRPAGGDGVWGCMMYRWWSVAVRSRPVGWL